MKSSNKLRRFLPAVAILLFAILFVGTARAAVVVSWDLTGTAGNQASQSQASAATNIIGLSITRGSGLTANAGASSFNSAGFESAANATPALDLEYVSLGFTVASGFKVDLTNFVVGTLTSGTGPGTIGLFYSGDNFTTALTTIIENATQKNSTIDLSALTNLTGTVEFRFIEIGNTNANGTAATGSAGTFRVNENGGDVTFNGTVSALGLDATAPEAGTIVTFSGLLGLYGFVAYRRQKRTA